MSGGLDSQLAVRVLQRAGAYVEGVAFATPFFASDAAEKAAGALGVKLHVVDFTDDELALLRGPPHGFGGAMNPCIDCHVAMIARAGELMAGLGFDFVATGEVLGQRPMSQNRQSLGIVEKCSGMKGRLVRPLSAALLEPTVPELEGLIDRGALLDISGRGRERQIALAAEFGIVDYPSPAGGCKLTEAGFCRRLKDLMDHEGLGDRRLVELLSTGRRFRLPGGSGVALGRDRLENATLRKAAEDASSGWLTVQPVNAPGPTALVPAAVKDDMRLVLGLVCAYSRSDRLSGNVKLALRRFGDGGGEAVMEVPRPYDRDLYKEYQIC
ncbi:MAG: tRNA 4-thiouridine(8) synthase ThiI [Kiritimatiellae bacterium]|nr:tRNA 4-thiouridine(8) synthase ThiI [Kiritimatiellia bacterium]